jgi:benzoyl-CoA reductase subunit C
MTQPDPAAIVARAEAVYSDLDFGDARRWKEAEAGRRVIGYLPVFAPIELISGAGMHALGVIGGGDMLEIIRGDAYFQSYICHLPRSVIELGVTERLDFVDGFLFPSTCDVVRNLSGMWQLLFPDVWVHYVDVPQDRSSELGGAWYRHELDTIRQGLSKIRGAEITDDEVREGIRLHNANRTLLRELYDLRSEHPTRIPTSEAYLIQRAGLSLPVETHNQLIREYIDAAMAADRKGEDVCRVVVTGSFCEQPPIGLLRTLERAGCAIVDDDLLLGPRLIGADIECGADDDPLDALVRGFLEHCTPTAILHGVEEEKGAHLIEMVRSRRADGVIFCAPSFCDPALLERPMLAHALDRAGIRHTSFKYSENTGQFQTIREQAGTFSDSLRLWAST